MDLRLRGRVCPLFISVLALLIVTFAITKAHAGYFDSKLKWHTIKTDHFNISFHEGSEIVAKKIATICEATHSVLSPKYSWKPFGRTEVVITDTTDISNAHAMTLPYNYILLFINAPTGDSTLNNFDDWLSDLIHHEYTHIIHIDKYGGIAKPFRWVLGKVVSPNGLTPAWVREGIAVVEESANGRGRNNSSFSDMMLRTDILNKQFLHLDQISGLTNSWPAGNSAYIYGGAFWQYLHDKYGQFKMQEFIERYGNSIWLFSLNNKARKVYDKNFFKLYAEWKQSLVSKYEKQKSEVEAKGASELQDLKHYDNAILTSAAISPDGSFIVYSKNDGFGPAELRRMNVDGSNDELIKKNYSASQISFYPDGKKIVFSYIKINRNRQVVNDLYELDLSTKKISTLTKKARATHASVSPDGKQIVFVASENASTQLNLLDIETKKITPLSHAPMYTQFSNPVFAPNGKSIAVSADIKGQRDILLMDIDGKHYKNLTQDKGIDNSPNFSKNGSYLYYSSDKSGISNIYRYHLASGKTEQTSNVLTGAFEPIELDGKVLVKNYYGRGYDLKTLAIGNTSTTDRTSKSSTTRIASETFTDDGLNNYSLDDLKSEFPVKKYNAFPKVLIPRYILPGFTLLDGSAILSAYVANNDPLLWHNWSAGITYRTDAEKIGFDAMYSYQRFATNFFTGYQDYAVSYGDLYRVGSKFFENRRRIFAGLSYPMLRQSIGAYYFYENRSSGSAIPSGATVLPTLGNLSGVGVNYAFTRTKNYNQKISPEGGPRVKANFEMTNGIFGSDNGTEQIIFSGDAREYIPMPYNKDHVLALKLAGGIAWGDKFLQGTFRLGSALGESPLTGSYSRLFQLRGLPEITFAGERAMVLSAEYRLPLFNAERGLGTGPIHMNAAHMAFFADWGSVWNGNPKWNAFLLGVGAELRGDFVLGYGMPITGRLGYGIIVDGREFIRNFNDPLLGSSLKYGTLILELGTSF